MDGFKCVICGGVVDEFIPEYCCSGADCGCMDSPIDPPMHKSCWEKHLEDKKREE